MAGTDTPDVGAPHPDTPVRPPRRVLPPDPATAPDDGGWTELGSSRDPAQRQRRLERTLWLLVGVVAVAGVAIIAAILASGPSSEAILPSDAAATDAPLAQRTGPIAGTPPDGEDGREARDGPPVGDDVIVDGPGTSDGALGPWPGNDVVGDGSDDADGAAGDAGGADGSRPDGWPGTASDADGDGGGAGGEGAPDGRPSNGSAVDDDAADDGGVVDDGAAGDGGGMEGDGTHDGDGVDGDALHDGDGEDDGAAGDRAPPSSTEGGGVPAGWSEVARGFGLAFTRTSVGRDAWFAAMSSWLTPEQAAQYHDVAVEAIPTGALVEIDVADPGSAEHAHGRLIYDTGMVLEIGLSYRAAAGGWLVARVELADTSGTG